MEIFKGVSPWFWSKNRTFYHGFGQKIEFFYHVCFLAKLSKKRSFFDILNKQDCFLDQKNRVLEKSKRSRFDLICKLTFIVHKARKTSVNILPQSCSSN